MQPAEETNGFTNLFASVFLAELKYLKKRRENTGLDSTPVTMEHDRLHELLSDSRVESDPYRVAPQTDIRPCAKAELVGLALSGGGIRSATFNLGIVQGLARRGVLRCCDYLSTVSGGGYIGACLSSLLNDPGATVDEKKFPFRFQRKEKPDERKAVKHLREHSNYLAVKGGVLDYCRMLGTYLSGFILGNFFPLALLILFGWGFHELTQREELVRSIPSWCFTIFAFSLAAMLALRGYEAVRTFEPGIRKRRKSQYLVGVFAGFLVVSTGLGLVSLLAVNWEAARGWLQKAISGVSILSVLGLMGGLIRGRSPGMSAVLKQAFKIGWVLVLPVLFAWFLQCLAILNAYDTPRLYATLVFAVFLLSASLYIDNNRTSLHNFYRDRLSEAYIVKMEADGSPAEKVAPNDPLRLSELHSRNNGAPYHLINATLNVPATNDRYLRGRGADLFLFSRNYVGSETTGYRKTGEYDDGKTRLATAMAISGAAASPQMGTSTNAGLRTLLALLNVRLNRWMPNPNPNIPGLKKAMFRPWYLLKELLGQTKESDKWLNLSDGGHHENLGIYPLLKRRCRVIIASDATADPGFSMNDLANVIRKARIDLGINIHINLEDLRPSPENGFSRAHFAVGEIDYPCKDPAAKKGTLIYFKSAMTGKETEDLLSYRRRYPAFPDQTTVDQFFDEAQFESYRKLGETAVLDLFKETLDEHCPLNRRADEMARN